MHKRSIGQRLFSFTSGVLLGALLPLCAFFIEEILLIRPVNASRVHIIYLAAIGLNLTAIRLMFAKSNFDLIRGMTMALFVAALLIFLFRFPL